ncbi:MAG: metallophosphoesterase family protein, partial [Oscillospiraceae bacterium]
MKKLASQYGKTGLAALLLAVFNAMFFFAMRSMWGGVYNALGLWLAPPAIMGLLLVLAGLAVWAFWAGRPRLRLCLFWALVVLLAALGSIFYIALGAWPFILREFVLLAALLAGLALLGLLVVKFPWRGRAATAAKAVALALCVLLSFGTVYGVRPGGFAVGPAVFAVEESYQIVFTTRADSTAWVQVGGANYYDTYAGSAVSETTVHKITVPMQALNEAGGYTLYAQTMVMRGPYYGLQGQTYQMQLPFYPVDETDGLQYYTLSDTHDFTANAARAAAWFGDKLDFLILNGDMASFVNQPQDLTRALKLANAVTGGSRPVVYARGNHEAKGNLAAQLHRYVGASGENFYYTFRLGSVWGVVLDMGEDHPDSWWEFYGTAHFNEYRARQLAFLQALNAAPETGYNAPGVTTRLAISHVPITYAEPEDFMAETKELLVGQLNQMKLSVMLSGHIHTLCWLDETTPAGQMLTDAETGEEIGTPLNANFPSFVSSRRSNLKSVT